MADLNIQMKQKNASGDWDNLNPKTLAVNVTESASKRFVSDTEKTTWNSKANGSHTHSNADITAIDASKITSGVIDIDRLPQGALERCVIVANDTARFALTTASIQKGDTVKVSSTGLMYFVVDDTKLTTEAGYEVYTAGSASSVPWSGITGKPSTFTPSAHNHTVSNITDFPTSLKNPNALSIKLGSNAATSYTGDTAVSVNVTPESIGATANADFLATKQAIDSWLSGSVPSGVLNVGEVNEALSDLNDGKQNKITVNASAPSSATTGDMWYQIV